MMSKAALVMSCGLRVVVTKGVAECGVELALAGGAEHVGHGVEHDAMHEPVRFVGVAELIVGDAEQALSVGDDFEMPFVAGVAHGLSLPEQAQSRAR